MGRMTPAQETHLKGWMMAVRHIGAGTGKRAARYRPVARELLQMCRSAIPAWIMPTYRVVEIVTPQEDAFDVAIVDEASQSGMDALFLHYIARTVVMVGDDKQIAPEYIGLNRDDVEISRRRYIPDIPLTHHYDLENSFFDQAFIRFGNRIRLTEHFRCMPEIIQFSNNLCYQNEPLIPLRQYGEERLPPVITSYVPEGYTKGQRSNVVNPPEAAAIIAQIETCCRDPRYVGKNMGVISLLGEHQARLIESGLLERIGPEEMERRRIVCGDAYAFQGDERNIIFLSLVVAPD
jgi:superfamily I DNA and/or RNA helicase